MAKTSIVVSALRARTSFGKLLQRVENEGRSLAVLPMATYSLLRRAATRRATAPYSYSPFSY
jgi:hypothetical protein